MKKKLHSGNASHNKETCRCSVCLAERGELVGEKNPFYGRKHTEESKRKMSAKGRKWSSQQRKRYEEYLKTHRYRHTEEAKKKISKAHKGKYVSEETRQKLREARMKQQIPFYDTSIELKIKSQLEKANINFKHPFIMHCKQFDFFLPDINLIIEADGDYWHSLPNVIKNDNEKNKLVEQSGISLLRLQECVIKDENFDVLDKL